MAGYYTESNYENAVLQLLNEGLGYTYVYGPDVERDYHSPLYEDVLLPALQRINKGLPLDAINEAIYKLKNFESGSLLQKNMTFTDYLQNGISVKYFVNGEERSTLVYLVDFKNPANNDFTVANQWTFIENSEKRPDVILFINGLPLVVVELKSPSREETDASDAYRQLRNYMYEIPSMFIYNEVCVMSDMTTSKAGTITSGEDRFMEWKTTDGSYENTQYAAFDTFFEGLFEKNRFLDILKNFICFNVDGEKTFKVLAAYHQYFAVKKAVASTQKATVTDGKGGVFWHTQGSGKSLTMVMLAKYILMELSDCNPKVVIVTDRKDLDRQITATFAHTRLSPARAASGRHLVELLGSGKADVVTTIINKFNTAEKLEHKNLSRDVFLLVDESHRSNYGLLAAKMRTVFPNACYIGFTGTPLMKSEKNTMARFGKLIHKYTIKDGVDDGAIVPLIYEGRFVEQNVDEANIDLWFKQTTKRLTEAQREDLSRKWSSIRRLTSTDARIRRIALDINEHFMEGYKRTGFKAMLATNYKRDAVRYLECFEQLGDLECAVVISPPDLRESVDDMDEGSDDKVIAYWNKMMNRYGDADTYEEAIKNQLCAGDIDILIVCSKLLTGFDAPICQVLYIDKELKEHGLLQAIARTNRLYEGKDYGLIVDYRGLIEKLDAAMDLYSGAGLENFDGRDLKGVVVDVMSCVGGLRDAYTRLAELFAGLKNPRDIEEVEVFLADDKIRESFYQLLCAFGKALSLVLNAEQAYAAFPQDELKQYQNAFVFFSKVRRSVKIQYCDAIDNREYEPLMQNLLDTHLSVAGLKQITSPINILSKDDFEHELEQLGTLRAKADAITSKLNRSISEKHDENPAYYDSFSKRIKEALEQYKEKVISEAEYLAKMRAIMEDYHAGRTTVTYPASIRSNVHAQAFYGVISAVFDAAGEAEVSPDFAAEIAEEITKIIAKHSQVDWTSSKTIHDRISQDIDDLFYAYEKQRGLKLSFETIDKIIENVKTVALRRF